MAIYPKLSAACEAQLCFGLSLNTFNRSSQSLQYSRNPARPCSHLMELNRHLGIVSWAALILSSTLCIGTWTGLSPALASVCILVRPALEAFHADIVRDVTPAEIAALFDLPNVVGKEVSILLDEIMHEQPVVTDLEREDRHI